MHYRNSCRKLIWKRKHSSKLNTARKPGKIIRMLRQTSSPWPKIPNGIVQSKAASVLAICSTKSPGLDSWLNQEDSSTCIIPTRSHSLQSNGTVETEKKFYQSFFILSLYIYKKNMKNKCIFIYLKISCYKYKIL